MKTAEDLVSVRVVEPPPWLVRSRAGVERELRVVDKGSWDRDGLVQCRRSPAVGEFRCIHSSFVAPSRRSGAMPRRHSLAAARRFVTLGAHGISATSLQVA